MSLLASSMESNSVLSSGILVPILSILFADAEIAELSISYCSIAELISVSSADFV